MNNAGIELVSEKMKNVIPQILVASLWPRGNFPNTKNKFFALKRKIHDDYDGVVLCKEVIPNPPIRGDYGCAFIPH